MDPVTSPFFNQSIMDLMLFAFASGAMDAIPNITNPSAVRRFHKKFGHICEDCSERALVERLRRMRAMYDQTLKSA